MIKRFACFAICLLLSTTVFAQDDTAWSVYLLDIIDNALVRVDADGTTDAFSLGLETDEIVNQNDMAISDDGALVAYCKTTPDATKILVIRDIMTTTNLQEIDFGMIPACTVSAFSADGTTIAVSHVYYPAFEAVPDGDASWSLSLINVEDGATVATLDDTNPNMPAFDLFGDDVPLLADVKLFSEDVIHFWGLPFVGMGGPPYVPAYEWIISDDVITQQVREYGIIGRDVLPSTGELIYPALDDSLPSAEPSGPMPQANVVEWLAPDQDVITIFASEDWIISNTTFINNGQQIAIVSVPGFSEGSTAQNMNTIRIDVVDRDGTITLADSFVDSYGVVGAVDGGMVIVRTPNPTLDGTYPPTQIWFWNGERTQVATYAPDYSTMWSPLQLIWTSPSTDASDLPAFTPMN